MASGGRTLFTQRLGAFGFVPHVRLFQLGVYFFETLFLGIVVKDTPKNVGALREVLNAVFYRIYFKHGRFLLMDLSKCGDKSGILPDSRPYSYTVVNLARGDR